MDDNLKEQQYREIRRVTVVGAVIDLALGVAKIFFGLFGHSQSLIADGVHSLSDLGTDALVLVAARHAQREADPEHPYGHERVQTAATVLLGMALIAVALGIGYDAVMRLYHAETLAIPAAVTVWIAFASVVLKEGIYHYTMHSARRLKSNILRANAWHSRSDAFSSIIVIVGILGTWSGLVYLDAVAAVLVTLMIAHIGIKLVWESFRELVDTGLDKELVQSIEDALQDIEGVEGVHQLRTRLMGAQALADVHLHVDSRISVSEGHRIGDEAIKRLIKDFDEINEVMVHVDPEDDDEGALSSHLPLRDTVMQSLRSKFEASFPGLEMDKVTLHYLGGEITATVHVPISGFNTLEQAQAFSQQLKQALAQDKHIHHIETVFTPTSV